MPESPEVVDQVVDGVAIEAVGMHHLIERAVGVGRAGAALVWLVYYTVLDSVQGIVLPWIICKSLDASADTQRFVATLTQDIYTDRVIGGVSSFVSLTGSWAFLVAAIATALALAQQGATLWPLLALVLAGQLIQMSHAHPYGQARPADRKRNMSRLSCETFVTPMSFMPRSISVLISPSAFSTPG